MTNPTPHGQVPEALRLADALYDGSYLLSEERYNTADELRRLHTENEALRTQQDDAYDHGPQAETVEEAARDVGKWLNERPNRPLDLRHVAMLTHHANRTAHVQNPAEIEHVAGDVSKNGAEVNMAYAELPTRYYLVGGVEKAWDHQQMRDFADATHALRASHGQAPAGATNTKTHELLSTTVGLLMGYREGAARQPYKPGSVIDKTVAEAVEHLKDWPYPESTTAAQAAESVTAPAGGAEEVDKALNDYAQAFMARAMGWTRENGDAMPDARTKLYSAISSYARGLFTTSTHAPGRQPAPEYVGNGMFKGETIEKAAEHWANWCDRRCMTGLSEFLRVVASRVQADSVLEDAARLEQIAEAIRNYHHALDMRQHGGVAQDRAVNAICNAIGMHWTQGAEAARRAPAAQRGGA